MLRGAGILVGALLLVFLTSCNQRAKQVEKVYATAYVILTRTSDAVSKLPTATPSPTQPTATPTAPVPSPLVELATVPEQQVEPSPLPAPTESIGQQSTQPPQSRALPSLTSASLPAFIPPAATNTLAPTLTQVSPTSTPPVMPPSQGLVGIWQQDPNGIVFQFKSDSTFLLANSLKELDDDPLDEGSYSTVNDQVTLTSSTGSGSCKGSTGSYQFSIPVSSQRLFTTVQESCSTRQTAISAKPWYWLPVRPGATPAASAVELPVKVIPLSGPLTNAEARITDLAWYGDNLLLLPQIPTFTGDGKSNLYALKRSELTGFINGVLPGPLSPQPVIFIDGGLSTQLVGFQGYQAITILDDKIFFLIQADPGSGVRSYLGSGSISSDLSTITLDSNHVIEVPAQPSVGQRMYLSLFVSGENIIALPQLNGAATNPLPVMKRFDKSLNILEEQSMSGVEYAITDASMPDANGRFWVINKYAPGDPGAISGLDPLAQLYGEGLTHQAFDQVERLVAYQLGTNNASLAALQPLQLELSAKAPRNWQGLADLGEAGFFMVANQPSGTLLVFVESP